MFRRRRHPVAAQDVQVGVTYVSRGVLKDRLFRVGKIEAEPNGDVIFHVTTAIRKRFAGKAGVEIEVAHMPVSAGTFHQWRLEVSDEQIEPSPLFEEGYEIWKQARGGVF